MKIINNTPCTMFHDVEIGCVFECAGAIFMRTDNNNTDWGVMNAVNLESGFAVHIDCDDRVHPLPNAHVIIE